MTPRKTDIEKKSTLVADCISIVPFEKVVIQLQFLCFEKNILTI